MLKRSLKNADISVHYFGMGQLLALRSCLLRPYLLGGMCLCTAAARGCFTSFLRFTAANSGFYHCLVVWWVPVGSLERMDNISLSLQGHQQSWRCCISVFPYKGKKSQWKRGCALNLVASAFYMCWGKLLGYYPSIFWVTWGLLEKTEKGIIVN